MIYSLGAARGSNGAEHERAADGEHRPPEEEAPPGDLIEGVRAIDLEQVPKDVSDRDEAENDPGGGVLHVAGIAAPRRTRTCTERVLSLVEFVGGSSLGEVRWGKFASAFDSDIVEFELAARHPPRRDRLQP